MVKCMEEISISIIRSSEMHIEEKFAVWRSKSRVLYGELWWNWLKTAMAWVYGRHDKNKWIKVVKYSLGMRRPRIFSAPIFPQHHNLYLFTIWYRTMTFSRTGWRGKIGLCNPTKRKREKNCPDMLQSQYNGKKTPVLPTNKAGENQLLGI